MIFRLRLPVPLLSFLFAFTAYAAEVWPEFRGPTGQGHSTSAKLPLHWSAKENVRWKIALPGAGWSSPVAVGDRIYLTTAVEGMGAQGLSLRVLCLRASDGGTVWSTETFTHATGDKKHDKNTFASPTPVVEGRRLYAHFGHLGSACLDLDGKVLWRNDELRYPPVHGNGGSPALTDRALIVTADGQSDPFVAALDKATGKLLWRTPRNVEVARKFSFSTPLVIEHQGRRQAICPGSGAVMAYDPDTGKELWRARYGEGYSVVPRPVYAHGLLYVASGFNQPKVIAIRPDGSGDVTDTHVAWSIDKGGPKTPSLIVVGDEIYFVSDAGIATCADAKSGRIHWSERIGGDYSASPLAAGGRLYFQSEQGNGVVLRAGTKFEKLAENTLGEKTLASYGVSGDTLLIRGEKHLFCIGSGKQ
jgi:outer membrane protein assembly factor BamB